MIGIPQIMMNSHYNQMIGTCKH